MIEAEPTRELDDSGCCEIQPGVYEVDVDKARQMVLKPRDPYAAHAAAVNVMAHMKDQLEQLRKASRGVGEQFREQKERLIKLEKRVTQKDRDIEGLEDQLDHITNWRVAQSKKMQKLKKLTVLTPEPEDILKQWIKLSDIIHTDR